MNDQKTSFEEIDERKTKVQETNDNQRPHTSQAANHQPQPTSKVAPVEKDENSNAPHSTQLVQSGDGQRSIEEKRIDLHKPHAGVSVQTENEEHKQYK